jgi:hypothetical protein
MPERFPALEKLPTLGETACELCTHAALPSISERPFLEVAVFGTHFTSKSTG